MEYLYLGLWGTFGFGADEGMSVSSETCHNLAQWDTQSRGLLSDLLLFLPLIAPMAGGERS